MTRILNGVPATEPPRQVRIVRVIARLNVGGPAQQAMLIGERLDRRRFRSLLVAGSVGVGEGDMRPWARGRSLHYLSVPELGRELDWRNDWVAVWKLYRLFRRTRPAVVHTHTAKAGTLGRVAAFLAGVPRVVHTFHGHVFQGYFGPWKTRVFLQIERWLARLTDRIVVLSESQREEMVTRYHVASRDRVVVIPSGFNLTPFLAIEGSHGGLRRELGLGPDVRVVAAVGRLVPVKNVPMLLEVAGRVRELLPEMRVTWVVVGDGTERGALERAAERLGLRDDVVFLGWRADMPTVYADADLVALTSINEGVPAALIEAMAASRPVVATRVGGVPDLVVDGISGRLVPSGDREGFAQAVAALLRHPDTRRVQGAAGRRAIAQRYGIDRLVRDLEALYAELLEEVVP